MKNLGDILVGIVVVVVAVLLIVLMIILGFVWFQMVGAIVAGLVTLAIELLIYKNWASIEENWLQPAIFLVAICFVGYWAWQGINWLYFAVLVPLGQSYVALVAGVLAGNPASVAIALPLGIVVAILIGIGVWRLVVRIKNR